MAWELFNNITNKEKNDAVENLFERSAPSKDFFLMVILSVLMAALGLIADSPAVIVGSMLIAPMLYPILGIAMGIIMSDSELVIKSTITSVKATGLGIGIAALVSLFFGSGMEGYTSEILARGEASLLYASIGAVAGLAAAFALVRKKLSETLPGVAISVALIPPLAVVGIALSRLDVTLFFSSLLLFLINVAGVIFTASIVFSMMNFYVKRNVAKEVVREEEEKIKKEEEEAEIKKAEDTLRVNKGDMDNGVAGMTVVFITALLVLIGGGTYVYLDQQALDDGIQPVACTLEAKICPDGSSVGRSGPNCEFAECPSEEDWSESSAKDGSISIISPIENETVIFPITVEGFVNNNDWMIFEGEAGTVRVYDSNDKPVSNVSILKLEEGWLEKSLSGQKVGFNTMVGDRQMISHLETDTGYLMFSSNGAKDDDVISKHKVLVKFQKSVLESVESSRAVPLGEKFRLSKLETVDVGNTGLILTITEFFNSPCEAQCIWSGVGIGFQYIYKGEALAGIDLVKAFDFQTTIVETDYETFADLIVDSAINANTLEKKCITAGCSGQLCVEKAENDKNPIATTCEWLDVYACYRDATCEGQVDGTCGWTKTDELNTCIEDKGGI